MDTGFAVLPQVPRFVLANATIPAALLDRPPGTPDVDGLVAADIVIADGKVERIAGPGAGTGLPRLDLDRGMVWPAFVDMHTHLDKGHIWPRTAIRDGTFADAIESIRADRARNWNADDLAARIDFSLRGAYAHGTALIRTHLDSDAPQHRISWPVFAEMRRRWAGRIDLQAVSIFPIDAILDDAYADDIVATVAGHGGVLGAFVFPVPNLELAIDKILRRAADAGLDLDFHVDETGDPAAHGLRIIADTALRIGFPGTIVAGHCCSLAVQPEAEAAATMDRVAEAGIAVVSLPMCNLHLQDRVRGRTPRWRGVTLVQELAERGVRVAVASDNTRDPFYDYGDLDMLEVFREAVRILQLDHPIAPWPAIVTRAPAAILGEPDRGVIGEGRAADLVLFRARTWTELLSRPQADRTVLRSGTAIDRTLPDYRELDDLTRQRS